MSDVWSHKDVWCRRHNQFSVEISRHNAGDDNVWCIYLHVFPSHPTFSHFKPDGHSFDQPDFDVHSYCSYFRVNRDNGGNTVSYTIGWDYNHDGDLEYNQISHRLEAWRVFADADSLYHQAIDRIHISETES